MADTLIVRSTHHPEARAVAERLVDVAVRVAPTIPATVAEIGGSEAGVEVAGMDVLEGGAEPELWRLEAAVLRALAPGHILFLCVANSARSQMGEGLARAAAPDGVKISSAGSVPTQVRPQAIAALDEVGIDIRHHRSKGTDDVERPVDAVITLCAEEVCPVWLEKAWRLHWGLPDPAGAGSTAEEEMQAFREVRDELRRRFEVLFRA